MVENDEEAPFVRSTERLVPRAGSGEQFDSWRGLQAEAMVASAAALMILDVYDFMVM